MNTPQELRETAKSYRETANAIYQSERREHYGEALNMLWQANRRMMYADMIEGKNPGMDRCVEIGTPKHHKVRETEEERVRDVRGRYKLFSTSYAEQKEAAGVARERVREAEAKREVREGFKELPAQFTFKL